MQKKKTLDHESRSNVESIQKVDKCEVQLYKLKLCCLSLMQLYYTTYTSSHKENSHQAITHNRCGISREIAVDKERLGMVLPTQLQSLTAFAGFLVHFRIRRPCSAATIHQALMDWPWTGEEKQKLLAVLQLSAKAKPTLMNIEMKLQNQINHRNNCCYTFLLKQPLNDLKPKNNRKKC